VYKRQGLVFFFLVFPFDVPAEVWIPALGFGGLLQRIDLVGIWAWFVVSGGLLISTQPSV